VRIGRVTALRIPCGLGRALGRDTDEHLVDEIAASAHANMRNASQVGLIRLVGSFGQRLRYLDQLPIIYLSCHLRLLIP
jgi:hypothetical protein